MSEPGEVDPEKLAALERRVAGIVRGENATHAVPPEDRVAEAVSRAHTDVLLKDTLALTVARMWATLAALLVPLFAAVVKQRDSSGEGSDHES